MTYIHVYIIVTAALDSTRCETISSHKTMASLVLEKCKFREIHLVCVGDGVGAGAWSGKKHGIVLSDDYDKKCCTCMWYTVYHCLRNTICFGKHCIKLFLRSHKNYLFHRVNLVKMCWNALCYTQISPHKVTSVRKVHNKYILYVEICYHTNVWKNVKKK